MVVIWANYCDETSPPYSSFVDTTRALSAEISELGDWLSESEETESSTVDEVSTATQEVLNIVKYVLRMNCTLVSLQAVTARLGKRGITTTDKSSISVELENQETDIHGIIVTTSFCRS